MDSLAAFFNSDDDDGGDSFFDLVLESPQRKELVEKAVDNIIVGKQPSSPVTVLPQPQKAKVFAFGFRRSTSSDSASDAGEMKVSPLSKWLLLKPSKCRAVFARGNSLRTEMLNTKENEIHCDVVSSGRPFPKYLKLMKPFYWKSSKKPKLTDSVTPSSDPVNSSRRKLYDGSSRITSFKVAAATGLGKIRSTSAVSGGPPQPQIRRRDDTLLEQHDGIQGAILYCKKSYNSSAEISHLIRSASDQSREKGTNPCLDLKRCSI